MPSALLIALLGVLVTSAFSGPVVRVQAELHTSDRSSTQPVVCTFAAEPQPTKNADSSTTLPPIRVTAPLPGTTSLALYPRINHLLRSEGEIWTPPVLLVKDKTPVSVKLAVTNTGELEIPLVNGTGQPIDPWPNNVAARFQLLETPLRLGPEQSFETLCPVEESNRHGHTIRCRLPEGILNLRLEADGYRPDYRWELHLHPCAVSTAPEYRLERGASLIGTVIRDDGTPAAGTEIVLEPTVSSSFARANLRSANRALEYQTTTNGDGFFQVRGLKRGSFDLRASMEGYGVGARPRLIVSDPVEIALDAPVVIPYFPAGVVHVDPATTPRGDPWIVRLFQPGGNRLEAQTDPLGEATFDLLDAGRYLLMVENADSERLVSEEVELTPDRPRVDVKIEQVAVIGTITLNEEPLAATLYFGGSHGSESVSIESGADGEFAGVLPRDGTWLLEVHAEDPKVRYAEKNVPIEVDPELGAAELAIDLPGTSIEGRVVDVQGKPVPGAQVVVQPESRDSRIVQVAVDEEGEFYLAGQRPGTYHVKALGPGYTSSATEKTEVSEDGPQSPLRLVLQDDREIVGHVVAPDGHNVAGATIRAIWERGSAAPTDALVPSATTGPDGHFTLHVGRDQPWSGAAVLAPGFVLGLFALPSESRPTASWELPLAQGGAGTLILASDGDSSAPPSGFVTVNGHWLLTTGLLSTWALQTGIRPTGAVIEIPELPSATYELCGTQAGVASFCDSGVLPPQGSLTLTLDEGR